MSAFDRLHPALQHHIVNSLGWRALKPTQQDAIDPVLHGHDVLLLAPTAGGKTEAAIFPVLSRMLSERWSGLSVLYVCPLRALLNNMEPRLAYYAGLLGRSVALWHGDVGAGKKRLALRSHPDLLLTTPESVESILISRRVDHSDFFSNLRVVIVDELHAFAGDDRGWHLLALLERLDKITDRHIQRIGLSATVGNPDDLAVWLAQTNDGHVVGRPTSTPSADVTIDYVGSTENAALVLSRVFRGQKRLVFCDSRAKVESLASRLRKLGSRTFVCHSSLSSAERRQAEDAFAQSSDCVIVATSTLELGIDVGDLDRVIQIDAPPTVSSFLQRMGRTGRRSSTSRNCLFLTTTNEALLVAAGLVRLWQEGFVENIVPQRRPLHILAQQIVALILQQNGLSENSIRNWLGKTFRSIETSEIVTLISYMRMTGVLAEDQGILGIGPTGEEVLGRRNFMDLLSAFTTPLLITVRYGNSELGEVAPTVISLSNEKPTILLLGGRSWRLTGVDWKKRLAWVEPSEVLGKSLWPGSSRLMSYALCRAIEKSLVAKSTLSIFSNRATEKFEHLRQAYAGCDGNSMNLLIDNSGQANLLTFAGSAVNGPISRALAQRNINIKKFDNFSVVIANQDVAKISHLLGDLMAADCEPAVPPNLGNALKFSACLPPGQAAAILSERLRDERGLVETLKRPVRVVRTTDG